MILALMVQPAFCTILALYVILNPGVFPLVLKHVPILDLFIISIGFVLRVLSGGVIAHVPVSQWLVVMIFSAVPVFGAGQASR